MVAPRMLTAKKAYCARSSPGKDGRNPASSARGSGRSRITAHTKQRVTSPRNAAPFSM